MVKLTFLKIKMTGNVCQRQIAAIVVHMQHYQKLKDQQWSKAFENDQFAIKTLFPTFLIPVCICVYDCHLSDVLMLVVINSERPEYPCIK